MSRQRTSLPRIAITTLMALMLLVSSASGATIVPIGGTAMEFQGQIVLGNLLDPAGRTADGTLTLINPVEVGDPVCTLVISTNAGPGTAPVWTMFEETTVIGEGTMDDFVLVDEGTPTYPPFGRSGVIFTAVYNGDGYVPGPISFPFSEVGTSTGDAVLGLGIQTWTGITVFGESVNPFPEPATMSLMVVGAVAMLRRKHQK